MILLAVVSMAVVSMAILRRESRPSLLAVTRVSVPGGERKRLDRARTVLVMGAVEWATSAPCGRLSNLVRQVVPYEVGLCGKERCGKERCRHG